MKITATIFLFSGLSLYSAPSVKFEYLSGHVQYRIKDGHWKDAKLGLALPIEAELETGPRGRAVIIFPNGSELTIAPLTRIALDQYATGNYGTQVLVSLKAGNVMAKIAQYKNATERNYFRVRTPTVVAGVRGTIQEVSYSPDRGTEIRMHESTSEMIDRARAKSNVPEGGKAQADRGGTTSADKVAAKENTTTLANRQIVTGAEHEASYNSGDPIFSPHLNDGLEMLRVYEKLIQDVFSQDFLIFQKF